MLACTALQQHLQSTKHHALVREQMMATYWPSSLLVGLVAILHAFRRCNKLNLSSSVLANIPVCVCELFDLQNNLSVRLGPWSVVSHLRKLQHGWKRVGACINKLSQRRDSGSIFWPACRQHRSCLSNLTTTAGSSSQNERDLLVLMGRLLQSPGTRGAGLAASPSVPMPAS